jgi:hypothetical protein
MPCHIRGRGGKLELMTEERRTENRDRRARSRGGRRPYDQKKPWYMRRRLWLATISFVFVGWRKVRGIVRRSSNEVGSSGNGVAA